MARTDFPRRLAILGSTGSIGRQTLDVVRAHPGAFTVVGLAAGHRSGVLADQAAEFGPAHIGLSTDAAAGSGHAASAGFPGESAGTLHVGPDAAIRVVQEAQPDVVVDAVPGFAGLRPALIALELGCLVAMAAKEAIVAGGHLLKQAAAAGPGQLAPVDGEPRAVLQCIAGPGARDHLYRVYLTASGGPFWRRRRADLERVAPAEALRHPRWSMGPKISVDSATLFNKGLEAIEIACLLDWPVDRIEILVHPESVVHSLVEFDDGSVLGQLGPRDMRVAISQALFHPGQAPSAPSRLGLDGLRLRFERPNIGDWPCLRIALDSGKLRGTMPAAVSAADEELVGAFLRGRIGFGAIGRGLEAAFAAHLDVALEAGPAPVLERLVTADAWAREFIRKWCGSEARAATGELPGQSEEAVR